jgi:hypothetical protein
MITSRRMGWVGCAAHTGEMRNVYKILAGKPEGKRQLGRLGRRENNIKMDLREVWLEGVDWIHMAQDGDQWQALVITIMNIWVP